MSVSSRTLIALLLIGVLLGACDKQSARQEQDNAATNGAATSGEVAPSVSSDTKYIVDRSKAGSELPDYLFRDAEGKELSLARFKGNPILVNLWATWCAPCVAEMPQLDRIAASHTNSGLQVLPISQDIMEADKVLGFFNAKGFRHIQPWLDADNAFGFGYGGGVLPLSVLYSREGKEVARVVGAPDWESAEAQALLEEAINE